MMSSTIKIPFDGKHFVAGEISPSVIATDNGPRPKHGIIIWYENHDDFVKAAKNITLVGFGGEEKE